MRQGLLALYKAGRYADVLALARDTVALQGASADLLCIVGSACRAMGRDEQALSSYRAAVRLRPDYALGWSNLGVTLTLKGWLRAAEAAHARALHLDPDSPVVLENLAALYIQAGDDQKAIAIYDRLLEGCTQPSPVHFLRAQARLRIGDLANGWSDYEHRLSPELGLVRPLDGRPRWIGDRRPRLLVATEQGFGDAIWAARFLPSARKRTDELSVRAPKELIRLFEGVGGVDVALPVSAPPPSDMSLAMMGSLGSIFAPDINLVKGAPYISRAPRWPLGAAALRVRRASEGLKVGFAWAGNTDFAADRFRSVSLNVMLRALSVPGIVLFSLQKGAAELQLQEEPGVDPLGQSVIPLGPLLGDFEDTRTAIAELDMVISVDTSVAHLAAAMGVPTWVLIGSNSYWVWGRSTDRTPWYDSARLFRVPPTGGWNEVFDNVATALMQESDKFILRSAAGA